jgi:hypothetical protein
VEWGVMRRDGLGGKGRTHVHRRKQELITRDARENRAVLRLQVHVLSEYAVPFCGCGAEDGYSCVSTLCCRCSWNFVLGDSRTASISAHSCRPERVMFLEAALLDGLLGEDVASGEEDLWDC